MLGKGENTMRASRQGICLWAVVWMVFCLGAHAQTAATPEGEYKQLIKVDQDIQPLGAHPFGENISLRDGTLSFEQTDVSVPGNGPTIQLGRSLAAGVWNGYYAVNVQYPFGDWDLNIPRIETITANPMGWKTSTPGTMAGDTNRCSNFTPPPYAPDTVGGGDGTWAPGLFWYGYHLILPGQGSQELMPRASANTLTPTISGMSFSIVTKKNWMIGCGVTASDGGEGFLAIAPDGTRYTFAHLVYRPMTMLSAPAGGIAPPPLTGESAQMGTHPMVAGGNILYRNDALMYVTQIQDRFGNTLTYHYDPTSGYLTSITASDGREVDVTYVSGSSLIHTVTAQATNVPSRTWTYSYGVGLTGVQLPDGSAWSYNLGAVSSAVQQVPLITSVNAGNCAGKQLPTLPTSTVTGSIKHPSGLTATLGVLRR
jgi:YD repeat-containing protein